MNDRVAVLVVEDEAIIRMAIVSELEDAGFDVFEADSADAAILILLAHLEIKIMITDIDMPGGVDGLKLAAAVRSRWPPIKIIVTSGYQAVELHQLPTEARFLMKPYDTFDVIESVRQMMAA